MKKGEGIQEGVVGTVKSWTTHVLAEGEATSPIQLPTAPWKCRSCFTRFFRFSKGARNPCHMERLLIMLGHNLWLLVKPMVTSLWLLRKMKDTFIKISATNRKGASQLPHVSSDLHMCPVAHVRMCTLARIQITVKKSK